MTTITAGDITALVVALGTLLTALAALIKVLQVQRVAADTHATVKKVDENTNGALADLKASVARLEASQATPAEIAARSPTGPTLSSTTPGG
jgi:hypothetical protein